MADRDRILVGAYARLTSAIRYPNDVAALREEIDGLRELSATDVTTLWRAFSGDTYAAGWIGLGEITIADFKEWLARAAPDEIGK